MIQTSSTLMSGVLSMHKHDLFKSDSEVSLDSEKSYEGLFKKTELYESLTYLTFNLVWMFIAAFANVILFVLYSYEVVFDNTFIDHSEVFVTILICNTIVIADIIAAIVHWNWKQYAALKNLPPRNKTDCASMSEEQKPHSYNINSKSCFRIGYQHMVMPGNTIKYVHGPCYETNSESCFYIIDTPGNAIIFDALSNAVWNGQQNVNESVRHLHVAFVTVFIIIDITSIVWMVIDLIPQLRLITWIAITAIMFILFRLYRVFQFFFLVSRTPGLGTFNILLEKYGIVVFIVCHGYSCLLQAVSCFDCPGAVLDWTSTANNTIYFGDEKAPVKWYIVCLYFVLTTISSVGMGDIHAVTDREQIILISMMLISFFFIIGSLLGAMTAVQMESYRRHSTFSARLELISSMLNHPRITKQLKAKIMNYYHMFWQQQKGIRHSYMFDELPETVKEQVYLEKQWNALKKTYLLKNIHPAFRRAIASVMMTEIYTAGEVIFSQGKQKDSMAYVLRGSVQILSSEDGESPVLTLGVGTCIGEINLIYSFPSPVQVVASSYCEIQRLTKQEFWRVAIKYYKLKQIHKIHMKMLIKLEDASIKESVKKYTVPTEMFEENEKVVERVLRTVKTRLRTEDPKLSLTSSIDCRKKALRASEAKTYSNLYILSLHQTTLKHSDEICLRTSWPWVLQPQSVFLTIWEYFLCACILVVAILYPYQISFVRYFPHFMMLIMVIIDGVYLIDIILQLFTAVEDENGVITELSDIFTIRCRKLSFIVDIISIIPLTMFATAFKITNNQRLLTILSVNRLFKVHRLVILFRKLGGSFNVNIAVVRCTKYILYLLMLSYLMGAIFYMLACFNEKCLANSWFDVIQKEDMVSGGSRYKNAFATSIYFGVLVISQNGFGDIVPHTMLEVSVTMLFFIVGTFIFCYLVADYSATLMLAERPRQNYIEMVTVIKQYLESNKMLASIQYRTYEYLALQWRLNNGYNIIKEQSLLFDAPIHLYQEQQSAKYFDVLSNIPLFQELNDEYIHMIAGETKLVSLPPHEIVAYAGEVVRNMYIIAVGFCEVVSAASGKREKVLGPKGHFGEFDMILGLPGIHHILTVTHARIMKISYTTYRKVFVAANLFEQTNKLADEAKSSLAVQRLFLQRDTVTYMGMDQEIRSSWFIFPRRKLDLRNIDYEKAFDNMGVWKFFKALLLRRTVMPDGNFLMIWEALQAVRVVTMGMYYVSLSFVEAYTLHSVYLWLLLDIFGYVDLYIRMHVCYYNDKGILVTHPKYTAQNYLTRGFLVDFCSLLPTPFILKLIMKTKGMKQQSTLLHASNILRMNRLLQLYRIPSAFCSFERNILKGRNILLTMAKFLPLSIVLCNAFANILITMTCTITRNNDGYIVIEPDPASWIGDPAIQSKYNAKVPFNLYIAAYYWVLVTTLQEGYSNFKAQQVKEMYFLIVVVVAGYLFFTYILVLISSCKAKINVNLTLYQEHMKHIISFMKQEKISRDLQAKVIDHFEYIWQRTHGMKSSSILKKCHVALREDSVLYLYEKTFTQVPIFADMTRSFYRLLGMHIEEAYFLPDARIIRLNDIISNIYIIHKGDVVVIAPDGSIFATLGRGSVFGNLDNVPNSRSMTSVVANKAVDLLCISTNNFYTLAHDYPVLANRMQRHISLENLSYIENKVSREQMQIIDSLDKLDLGRRSSIMMDIRMGFKKILAWGSQPLPMMLMSFFSCLIVMYQLSFQNHSYPVLIITYGLDVFHIVTLYAGFKVPYRARGAIVTDPKKIRHRFLTRAKFYIELAALVPFDVFAIIAPTNHQLYYLSWLRINRMLRIWNIFHFFNVTFDRLNINVLIIKLGSVCIYLILMIHIASCILYMTACPAGECIKGCWLYNKYGKIHDNNHYLISVYFMMSIITATGFGDVLPTTLSELIVCIIIMLLGKFIMAVFLGDISAMVQNYSYTLVSYDYNMTTLKEYLQRSYVAGPLVDRVLNYMNQLWTRDRGLQLPVLLHEAPNYLLEDVKAAVYGKHLSENYIFVSCHVDFLRQLTAKVKAQTFFRADIICQQGDVNNTMYFIHKGLVNVYAVEGQEEIHFEQLGELDCFGLVVQGLFASTPHSHTYKAETVAVILTLDLFDWVHLLKYFRAARYEIYNRIQKMARHRK